jgi:hypothetical protein
MKKKTKNENVKECYIFKNWVNLKWYICRRDAHGSEAAEIPELFYNELIRKSRVLQLDNNGCEMYVI